MTASPKVLKNLSFPNLRKGWFNTVYENPWSTFKFPSVITVCSALLNEKNNSNVPDNSKELDQVLPIKFREAQFLQKHFKNKDQSSKLKLMWIGHSSSLLHIDGLNVLTDPIFSDRCSAFQFLGPKRFRAPPCQVCDLPEINAVVLSHTHYDHLDYNSVGQLHERFSDNINWLIPIGLKKWMLKHFSIATDKITEMSWWDEKNIPINNSNESVKFVFTPAQHWTSRQLIIDSDTVLWGSWTIIGPKHRFFFSGDTGYCETFKEIGDEFGPFDLATIPIGAYKPRKMMISQHVNPEEAIQIHHDIKSKRSIGIHWGTFNLSYEHFLEPREELEKYRKIYNTTGFTTIAHGDVIYKQDSKMHLVP